MNNLKQNFSLHLILAACSLSMAVAVRYHFINLGMDIFTANTIFFIAFIILVWMYLTSVTFAWLVIRKLAKRYNWWSQETNIKLLPNLEIPSDSPPNITPPNEINIQALQEDVLLQQQQKKEKMIVSIHEYALQTMAEYMDKENLTTLSNELYHFLSHHTISSSSKSVMTNSQLKQIDLMHFGWNIAQPMQIPRRETSKFIKYVFYNHSKEVEEETIYRKMTNKEQKCIIQLKKDII